MANRHRHDAASGNGLKAVRLNPHHPLPLYEQIRQALLDHAERAQPGLPIPSETSLAQQFHTSRMTVRQAVDLLVGQGILHRRQGVGTFVAAPKARQDLAALRGFSEEMRCRGLEVSNRVVLRRLEAPKPAVAQQLRLRATEKVVAIQRVRLVDGVPLALETAYLPADRFAALLEEDLQQHSLFDILEQRFGCRIAAAEHAIEPVNADAPSSRLLQIKPGTALIKMEGCSFDADGQPVEYVQGLYRGDRYRLGLSLRRVRSPTASGRKRSCV